MELTVQNVYGLLLRSRLMPIDDARAMYARWQEEARDGAGNTARFASWMVAHKYITEYQAALLSRGHADGFYLNEYKVLDRLGKGRMAGVYKAQHPLGQIVAIKVLPPSKAKDPTLLARFHRETRLALRLKHPNIVRAFQTGMAGDVHYLVMEYLEGETLDEVLQRRGKMPPQEGARLVYQALQGLQHIHSQGLIHRDLKPANLMLVGATPDSTLRATLKILDIGLGKLFEEGMSEKDLDAGLTGEGVILGTPDYMAPEQAREAKTVDIRADIYSLGCVLYHLLAGQPPFPDTNLISQMIRHATETARPLKDFNPAVPDGLQQIVNWMLAKAPDQRYPTPERAAQALQVFLAAGTEALASPEADPGMSSYLTWLEREGAKEAAPVAKVVEAAPVAAPVAHPVAVPKQQAPGSVAPAAQRAAAKAATADKAAPRQRRKQRNRPAPGAVDVEPAVGVHDEAAPQIDVELVALPGEAVVVPVEPVEGPRRALSFSRRELIAFGIGAVAGSLVTAVGCWIALRNKGTSDPDK